MKILRKFKTKKDKKEKRLKLKINIDKKKLIFQIKQRRKN